MAWSIDSEDGRSIEVDVTRDDGTTTLVLLAIPSAPPLRFNGPNTEKLRRALGAALGEINGA